MDLVPLMKDAGGEHHQHAQNQAKVHQHEPARHDTHRHDRHGSAGLSDRPQEPSAHQHDKHAGHHTHDFLKRFWISLVITLPILALSHMIQEWAGFNLSFHGDQYVLFALGTLIYLYGGMPFLKGMTGEIKANAIGMMTLVAVAISVAYFYSVAVVFGLPGMDFFWELATLIVIMLLGHWLEMRSQMAASKALQSLVALLPNEVTVEKNGEATRIQLSELANHDIVIIKPGDKIPADGEVIEGLSYVNESMLTGESVPVKKELKSKVIAGSINGDGALKIDATGVGKDSYLNKVINLVQDAQAAKSNTQNLADKVAKWLTFVALGVGAGTFIYWLSTGSDLAFALERMVTVMVTACPHALGVAIPLVVAISTTLSATNGLLIRNRTAFETTRKLTTVIFDKTGTLTEGSHAVKRIIVSDENYTEDELIQYAAAVQQNSEHHIAKGTIRLLKERKLPLLKSEDFRYMQGIGVKGTVNQKEVVAAGPNYFVENKLEKPVVPSEIDQDAETVSYVWIDGKVAGILTFADSIREGSLEAVQALNGMGIKSFLLTGDNEKIAASVSKSLGMAGFLANVLPHNKQEKVREYQEKGEIVAMTGDGVNDAPALAQADVGIAVGSGTDVAAETADIILVNSDPRDVVKLIDFGRRTYRKMIQNLGWAVGYNIVAIPLAAGIFYPKFVLSPAAGAVLMSVSTIVVALNATLLKLDKK
ncbi:heavy metal translocating P-type ATPase [Ravibacter arvi]|uniref:Heavy metal translocating P-type ATPase n=2 Tax=Ravibacter arvi TaxID=2051041 RepID=A0ABP8LYS3_9BACT